MTEPSRDRVRVILDVEELTERVAFAMAVVIAKRHGHQHPDDWLNDQRREEARAAIDAMPESESVTVMREALEKCRDKFREYELSHLAKFTEAGDEKAARNAEMAKMCREALTRIGCSE